MTSPLGRYSKENIVIFKSLDSVNLSNNFDALGWTTFINIKTPLYPRLVQGFYACIRPCNSPLAVKGTLRGVDFELNIESLNAMIGAPNSGLLFEPKQIGRAHV